MSATNHLDSIEAVNSTADTAVLTRTFYASLCQTGFKRRQALALTKIWLAESIRASAVIQLPGEGER